MNDMTEEDTLHTQGTSILTLAFPLFKPSHGYILSQEISTAACFGFKKRVLFVKPQSIFLNTLIPAILFRCGDFPAQTGLARD